MGKRQIREIILGENLAVLQKLQPKSVELIYIDPPFNTGRKQQLKRIRVKAGEERELGDRVGFGGRAYSSEVLSSHSYSDNYDDYINFLRVRCEAAKHLLTDNGSFFLHVDYREVHYCKVMLDQIFGRAGFMNEIIWAYDYGGRSKRRWSAKHDNILWYVNNPNDYIYNYSAVDRIPYIAPGLVTPEKAARGKTPTDVWWNTIVPTNSKERTGYPTQKPLAILERIVRVHSAPGDTVLDFFAGSGTTGVAAVKNNRNFILIDENPVAVAVSEKRLAEYHPEIINRTKFSAPCV